MHTSDPQNSSSSLSFVYSTNSPLFFHLDIFLEICYYQCHLLLDFTTHILKPSSSLIPFPFILTKPLSLSPFNFTLFALFLIKLQSLQKGSSFSWELMDADQDGYSTFAATPGIGKEYVYVSNPHLSFQDQVREFMKGAAELSVQFSKGCRDVLVQSFGKEDSFLVRNFGRGSYVGNKVEYGCDKVFKTLKGFNEYLPEDKDPVHSWSVICIVFVLAFAVLNVSNERDTSPMLVKKVFIHPPSADRILLPDGRYIAYREQGVSVGRARFSIIAPHAFLSSRLAGLPGLKVSLLEEFGIYLLTYDLPGFGESDPHPNRNLQSSAFDMLYMVNALGVKDKFWVMGYSSASLHAWAALHYIPERVAGAAMFAPLVNPYDSLMTRDERRGIWEKWNRKRKFMYFLARRFPRFLSYFYHRSFLSGRHEHIDMWLSLSLGKRDKALVEDPIHEEFRQRDVEESIRQGNVKPFIEEAVLQVSNWGFSLSNIKLEKKKMGKGILNWLKYLLFGFEEEYTGFLGPIHIWQGMEDMVVPPVMTDFVHRVLPGAAVHKLPYEGHFTYIYFCDECHRQIFTTVFGIPRGPLNITVEVDQSPFVEEDQTPVENCSNAEEADPEEQQLGQMPLEVESEAQEELTVFVSTELR